jgi:small subunit ribosomal protein S9
MAEKTIVTTGKRKGAVARATIQKGDGKITINGYPIELWTPEYTRMRIREPLILAGDLSKKVTIRVNSRGGGKGGQSDAIRQSIARAMVEFYNDEKLKKVYAEFDKNLLSFDDRRTESHKPSRSRKGARRHKQRSKR